jgi:hypothetical protein
MIGDDVGGLAVHIAARVAAMAPPDEVLVSGTVRDLVVGSEIEFSDRGRHALKGAPGEWNVFAVVDSAPDSRVGTPTSPEKVGGRARVVLTMARHAPWLMRYQSARALRRSERPRNTR